MLSHLFLRFAASKYLFSKGIHSFTIIGTYGTGKSSFLAALQRDLLKRTYVLVENHNVFGIDKYEFLNIVGDYASLSSLLAVKLELADYATSDEILSALNNKYEAAKKAGKFFIVVVDEKGNKNRKIKSKRKNYVYIINDKLII